MPDTAHLLLFLPAMVAITLLPGPDMLFVIAQSIRGGRRAGITSVCGIIAGGTVQIGAAIIGLSALVVRSAVAFEALKYAGALYLVYLGVRTWRERSSSTESGTPVRQTHGAFVQGFLTNALNPKVALFCLAFLPQFVVQRGSVPLQIAVFGILWYAFGFIVLSVVALAAHRISSMGRTWTSRMNGRKVVGGIFIALGLAAAIPARR